MSCLLEIFEIGILRSIDRQLLFSIDGRRDRHVLAHDDDDDRQATRDGQYERWKTQRRFNERRRR